jgi:hypothetical protein
MAKRVRTTGLPKDQAREEHQLARIRDYTGYQCPGCPLHGTCDPKPPPGGPWEVIEAEPDRVVICRVNPNIEMVPVKLRRIKQMRAPPPPPKHERREHLNILLDANAIIEGAKGTFKGMIHLLLEPPNGFNYHTTESVHKEIQYLKNVDKELVLNNIQVVPDPETIDPRILDTHGKGITPPTPADASLWQLAYEDDRFHMLVSHDRFHRGTGLATTLGIQDRLTIYSVSDFVKYAKRHR